MMECMSERVLCPPEDAVGKLNTLCALKYSKSAKPGLFLMNKKKLDYGRVYGALTVYILLVFTR